MFGLPRVFLLLELLCVILDTPWKESSVLQDICNGVDVFGCFIDEDIAEADCYAYEQLCK